MRILISSNARLMRELLADRLAAEDDLRVIGEAESAQEALERCMALEPDILLVDARYSYADSVALAEIVAKQLPGLPVSARETAFATL